MSDLETVKELFTSIITRLEILAVHIERVIREQVSQEKERDNDCNS